MTFCVQMNDILLCRMTLLEDQVPIVRETNYFYETLIKRISYLASVPCRKTLHNTQSHLDM